ncbi:hypothetical protein H4219_002192 [Mycoemilia scoparia]|uniref:Uncharacterized protein n=1 Tax=Mycoemilia scoparia TaxID=417184 RepID=A0A9W8A1V3_9FUNG|nr:hypothetical protein H4219_002192 [Mycoemilia scoparia]
MKRFLESVGLLSSKRPRIDEPSQDILQGEKETEEESKVEEVEEENEIQEPLEGYDDIEEDLEEPDESDGGIELDYQILHDDDEDEDYQPEKTPEMSDSDDGRAGGIALAHKSSSPIPGSPELGPEYASPPKKRKARAKTDIVEDDMIVDDSQESAAIDSSDSEDVELRDEGAESVKADSELASPQPEDDQDYLELSYKPKKIGQIPLSHLKWTLQQMIDSSNNDLTEQILAREGIGCTGQKFLWPFPLSWKYFQEILDSSDYTFNSDYQDTSILYVDQGEDFTSDDEIVESDGEIDSDFSERSVDFDITNPKSKSLFEFVSIGTLKAKGYLEGKQKSSQYNDGRESENHKDGTASKKTIAQGAPWSKFIEAVPLYEYPTLFWNSNPSDEHSFTDDVELGRAFNAMIKSDILKTLPRHRQILSTYTRSIVSSESTRSLGKIWDVLYMIHSKQSVKKNNPSFIRSKSKHMDWVTVLQAAVMIDMPEE